MRDKKARAAKIEVSLSILFAPLAHALIRKKVKCANAGGKGCDRIVLGPRAACCAGEREANFALSEAY